MVSAHSSLTLPLHAFYIFRKSDLEKLREKRKNIGEPDWEHPSNARWKDFAGGMFLMLKFLRRESCQ